MKKWTKVRCCRRCGAPVKRENNRSIDFFDIRHYDGDELADAKKEV